jgi:hypothetical protein
MAELFLALMKQFLEIVRLFLWLDGVNSLDNGAASVYVGIVLSI